jgi:hypothetical protein
VRKAPFVQCAQKTRHARGLELPHDRALVAVEREHNSNEALTRRAWVCAHARKRTAARSLAHKTAAQGLCARCRGSRSYLERGLCAHERLDLHLDSLAVLERARRDTGEVESLQACASASPHAPPGRDAHTCA